VLIQIHFGPFVTPQVVDQQCDQNHIGRLDELLNQVATLFAKSRNNDYDYWAKELAKTDFVGRNSPHYR